jgi:hypothetical protein
MKVNIKSTSTLRCLFKKMSLIFVSLLFMVSLFSSTFISEANGTGRLICVDAGDEFELRAAISTSPHDSIMPYGIDILRDIILEKPLEIPEGKNIILASLGGDGVSLIGADGMDTIIVKSGGTLSLWDGLVVTHAEGAGGRGVYVERDGKFILSFDRNGAISGNSAMYGGGVYNEGTFHMFGAYDIDGGNVISGNTAMKGGGVYNTGEFAMMGGVVCYNNCTDTETSIGVGGGVYNEGAFYLTNGHIFGNSATKGGGLYTTGIFDSFSDYISEDGYRYTGSIKSNVALSGEGNNIFNENIDSGPRYLLPFVAVVIVVGFVVVVAGLLFYRSKRQRQLAKRSLGGSDGVV